MAETQRSRATGIASAQSPDVSVVSKNSRGATVTGNRMITAAVADRSLSSQPSCRRPASPRRRLVQRLVELADMGRAGRRPIRARRRCGGRSARSAGRHPAAVHCSICRSPSELPEAKIGPPADEAVDADRLAGPSSTNSIFGCLHAAPACRRRSSNFDLAGCCRRPARVGCHRPSRSMARMNSMPPPETMKVLKPLARR